MQIESYSMRKLARFFSHALALGISILPQGAQRFLALFLTWLWVDLFQIRKKVVFSNMDIAFPGLNDQTKENWMRQSIFTLARGFIDVLKIPYLKSAWIDHHVIFHGLENIPKDQGFFFVTLHLGSGDLAAAVVSEKIVPLSLISKRFTNTFADEFWFSLRTKSKTQFIDAHGQNNAFEILKALKSHRAVVFVLDQFMGRPYGIESSFFGRLTGTAYGLALFVLKTKKPVLPLYTYWDNNYKLHITVGNRIDVDDCLNHTKDEAIKKLTQRFNDSLEKIIRQHPEQWMWVHRRWKDFT